MSQDTHTDVPAQPSGRRLFAMIDNAVIDDETLHPHVKLVYMALARFASTEREVWPSRATIAKKNGLSMRAVSTAVRAGSAAGLWQVEHRHDGDNGNRQTSNLYRLLDFGNGFTPVGVHPVQGDPVQDMQGPGAGGAHEQDNGPTQAFTQTRTSSDAACGADSPPSGARSTSGRPIENARARIRLYPKPDYWSTDKIGEAVCRYADSAVKAVGLELTEFAKKSLGQQVKKNGSGRDRQWVLDEVQTWLTERADDELFVWPERKAS